MYGSYEDASAYLSFNTDTRTITSLATPALDDEFLIRVEGVANDGRCTQSQFTISNPCVNNALSKSGNGLQDQTYAFASTAIVLYPSSFLTTSVSQATCPLTYTYYVWSDAQDNWVLQSSNSAPFSAFSTSDGALTVSTSESSIFQPSTATSMTYRVKWVITDQYSNSNSNQVEEVFDLTVEDQCANNQLSQSGTIEEVLHYTQSGSATVVQPTVSGTASGSCPLTYQLFFYDENNYEWKEYTSGTASSYAFV